MLGLVVRTTTSQLPPKYNCFICLNGKPSRIRKATNEGKYPNGWQNFYYCDDVECAEKYTEMHQNHKAN